MTKRLAVLLALILIFASRAVTAQEGSSISGTGIIPGVNNGYVVVKGIYRNSPAEKAGIRLGNRLMKINGRTEFYRGSLFHAGSILNPPPGSKVEIVISHFGKLQEYSLTSVSIPLTGANMPKSDIPDGRIREIRNMTQLIGDYSQRGPAVEGDKFYLVMDDKVLGKVSISSFREGVCHLAGPLSMAREVKDRLSSVKLVFCEDSGRMKNTMAMKDPAVELKAADAAKEVPVPGEDLVGQYMKRKDLDKGVGEVVLHNERSRSIMVKVVAGRSQSMVSPTQAMVTTRYEFITIKYLPTVPIVPTGTPMKAIKRGDTIGFFFKQRGDEKFASLIHLLKK